MPCSTARTSSSVHAPGSRSDALDVPGRREVLPSQPHVYGNVNTDPFTILGAGTGARDLGFPGAWSLEARPWSLKPGANVYFSASSSSSAFVTGRPTREVSDRRTLPPRHPTGFIAAMSGTRRRQRRLLIVAQRQRDRERTIAAADDALQIRVAPASPTITICCRPAAVGRQRGRHHRHRAPDLLEARRRTVAASARSGRSTLRPRRDATARAGSSPTPSWPSARRRRSLPSSAAARSDRGPSC